MIGVVLCRPREDHRAPAASCSRRNASRKSRPRENAISCVAGMSRATPGRARGQIQSIAICFASELVGHDSRRAAMSVRTWRNRQGPIIARLASSVAGARATASGDTPPCIFCRRGRRRARCRRGFLRRRGPWSCWQFASQGGSGGDHELAAPVGQCRRRRRNL